MMDRLFIQAKPIILRLKEAGYEAYYVGGAVRDYILKREIHDIDIATSATPMEVKSIFSSTVDVGIEHGTILVIHEGRGYEVTTFRAEAKYVDFRRPESVSFIRSLQDDLRRRDFTINAMAMDEEGIIKDPFNGREAIEKRCIKTVGSATERFGEDALRLMRAIRFVSQLGFKLDSRTEEALIQQAPLLQNIAIERILLEMEKLLKGKKVKCALKIARKSKLNHYWPAIFNQDYIIDQIFEMPIEELTLMERWLLALYLEKAEEPQKQLKKWKMPTKEIKKLQRALSFLTWRMKNKWTNVQLYRAGKEIAGMVEKVACVLQDKSPRLVTAIIYEQFAEFPITDRSQLAITGTDVLKWKQKAPGAWISQLLNQLEEEILNQKIPNEREMIRGWVKEWENPSSNKYSKP
ncbi:CCA tRNA nucleotidyltransferase [Bacillus sp. SD088]|nr:CCA tRNA nucleotidyltransferase [Bacillus sp. SD088]